MLSSLFGPRSVASLRPSSPEGLRLCGQLEHEREVNFDDLRNLPAVHQIAEVGHYAKGVKGQAVRLAGLFELTRAKPHPLFINAGRRDGSLRVALYRRQIEQLALVLYALDGKPLSAAQGGPFRLILPGFHDAARDIPDLGWIELAKRAGPDNRAEFARTRQVVVGQQSFDAARTWRDPREADTIVIPQPNA